MRTRGGERKQSFLSQMDREGSEGMLNPHSGREWLDHLEAAEGFPRAATIGGRDGCECQRIEPLRKKAKKEGFVQIVLKAWSSNPDYNTGCDYAVVEGGEAFLKLALWRINVLCEQKIFDPSLNETYYWDFSAQYFSPGVNRALQFGEAEEACVKFEESIEALEIDTREVAVASSDFAVPDSQVTAVECAQMIVRDGGIAFNALLRHSDIYVTTAEIPKQVIESALTAAIP
jgi:hypothetical protein